MLHLVLLASLTAAPKLALPDLRGTDLKPGLVEALSEHLAQQLTSRGLRVTSARDIATVLGLERQKQLLGCADDSCTAELAGALGVDAVVSGSLSHVGSLFLVNVRVVSSKDGQAMATFSQSAKTEEELPAVLEAAAGKIATDLNPPTARKTGAYLLVPLGIGVLSAIGAGISVGFAAKANDVLRSPTMAAPGFNALEVRQQGQSAALAAYILSGVALTALVTTLVLWLTGVGS